MYSAKGQKYGSKRYAKTLSSVERTIQELHDGGQIDAAAIKKLIEAGLQDLETKLSPTTPNAAQYLVDEIEPRLDAVSAEWPVEEMPSTAVPVDSTLVSANIGHD